ncbi:MAG: ABC transporter permease [Spongiibacteraceae bacterium]
MRAFLALLRARNIEFFRDRSALAWSFLFPMLMIIGCAIAFSKPDPAVFRIGLHGDIAALQKREWLRPDYLEKISFDHLETAQQRVQHHQIDLLISIEGTASDGSRYWSNPESKRSQALLQLLGTPLATEFHAATLHGRPVRYVDWVMPGVLGMNMMFGALFGVGYVIVRYRQNGVLKRLQATPVKPLEFIAAQLVSRLWIVAGVNLTIFIACKFLLNLLVLGSLALMLLIFVAGALAMISLGLLIASRTASEEFAGGLLNLATWPMMFLSEVWFSLDNAPVWLQRAADLMPLTHVVKAARAVMIEGAGFNDISGHLLVLLITTVVCMAAAARLFRWHTVK